METLLIFSIFIALYLITKHLLNKIRNLPPSPFPSLPIISHLYYLLKKPIHITLTEISKRKGPVVLFQFGFRRVLVVSSPSAAEECFTKNDIVFTNRPHMLIGKHFGYNYTSLGWSSYGEHWRNLRRIASLEMLSSTRLQMLSGLRFNEVRSLVHRIFHNQNQSVNMRTELFELTMNVMMRMIAGKRYYGENAADLEEAKRFKEICAETFKLGGTTNIGDYLPWFKSKELEKGYLECQRKRDEFMQGLVDQHRSRIAKEKTKTLIEVLLALQETDPEYYIDDVISGLMLVLLLGGTHITMNAMEWAVSLLLNHPEELKKAQREIDNSVGHSRLIEECDLAQLPHLGNIINETLRLYPPVPLLVPHESSEECTVQGFRIPRGTTLLVNCWAIQNDPKVWVDPREFKPERFGNGGKGNRDGFGLIPFGSGRRGCPGEGLALRMVGLGLGAMVQCFDWNRIGEEMVDMREGTGTTMPKAHPLVAKFKPRQIMVDFLSQI
ncbi:hypothetical protein LWI29_034612 [Acer saccharum]|uniref:Cytochrome P450 n=1 Tax=Acer saccharum TaxID=4024 RepID=A0AA39RNT3_ACESA|nr:hypothetical protein LWI29_034612 [Acer saccharum]